MIKLTPVGQQLYKLRNEKMLNYVLGDYKAYKKTAKEFAKMAVANQDEFKSVAQIPAKKITVPLFSSQALKMLKVWFLEKFRIKTPEEKALKKMAQRNYFERQYISNSMPKTKDNSFEHVGQKM